MTYAATEGLSGNCGESLERADLLCLMAGKFGEASVKDNDIKRFGKKISLADWHGFFMVLWSLISEKPDLP